MVVVGETWLPEQVRYQYNIQDAVDSQTGQLQRMLQKQLTGKAIGANENSKQAFLGGVVWVRAMRRALVVLDDPWLPEQVRYQYNIQDAVGTQTRQLHSMLHKQLTGKASDQSKGVQEKTEQEWLDELVEAMTMRRALVVLDDPWQPEQVRFLNPVDRSRRTEHRLLVTTRIRDLVPKATCIELGVMGSQYSCS